MGRFDAVFNNVDQIRKRLAASELMTLKEVAQMLDVDRDTVRRWVEEGKLRAYYPSPRQMRFNREEVSQLLLEEAKRRGLTIHTIGRGDCECDADTVLTCPIYQPGGGRCQSDGPGEGAEK